MVNYKIKDELNFSFNGMNDCIERVVKNYKSDKA